MALGIGIYLISTRPRVRPEPLAAWQSPATPNPDAPASLPNAPDQKTILMKGGAIQLHNGDADGGQPLNPILSAPAIGGFVLAPSQPLVQARPGSGYTPGFGTWFGI